MDDMLQTPLYEAHVALGAKMVPFAGYEMPVQYPMGVMAEHQHTRASAGLFDVSHMGQVRLTGGSWQEVALAFEALVPQDVLGLADGRQRYGFFTTETGGLADDLMFARDGDDLLVVINAACKAADIARMRAGLTAHIELTELEDRALLAVQGPQAEAVLAALDPAVQDMRFMDLRRLSLNGIAVWATRSGYTGEDGFEISVPDDQARALWDLLLQHEAVAPIGLAARDSLRLEAGLCLYGQDISEQTTPLEACLAWAMQKARKPGGARAGGYPGFDQITKPGRLRVGLKPEGRAPMRAGVALYPDETSERAIGTVTSGGFGPSLGAPVAMGYVTTAQAQPGTQLYGEVRGKRLPVTVTPLPFIPNRFKR